MVCASAARSNMTEFWKSGARHWCTYCKIFINGTKPSIAYHESGKKHKEIVELYLKEMRVRAREKGKDKKELEGELAKIERAALKQYQRDDAGSASSSSDARRPRDPEAGDRAARLAALEAQIEASKLLRSGVGPGGLPVGWRMQSNPDGVVYYEHIPTGVTQWEPPVGTQSAAAEEASASTAAVQVARASMRVRPWRTDLTLPLPLTLTLTLPLPVPLTRRWKRPALRTRCPTGGSRARGPTGLRTISTPS